MTTIYHNPRCSTSRRTLELLRERGEEPEVIEYLANPPSRNELQRLLREMGIPPRVLLRKKEARYAELGLDDPSISDDAIVDAMVENPILIERPIVETSKGVRLCRPVEKVLEIL
ncbi:MAG TPA: arsenate reductase (glutaredoxin) [Vulgatibacter sp.]|nr:arsenate reductase (glutaredoxin) [Vulgatibacter sp.]